MYAETQDGMVPVLTDYRIGTLDDQDLAIVLQFARSPEDLLAGITSELALAMTPEQARRLGAGLLATVRAAEFEPAAANDTNTLDITRELSVVTEDSMGRS